MVSVTCKFTIRTHAVNFFILAFTIQSFAKEPNSAFLNRMGLCGTFSHAGKPTYGKVYE